MKLPSQIRISISNNGRLTFIYDDALAPLLSKGVAEVKRVSFVEPSPDGGWTADMSPVAASVVLGPFPLRSEALAAEVEFLERTLFA